MEGASGALVWGILGCANIAQKNIRAILLSRGNRLGAIASRSREKCEQFVRANQLSDLDIQIYGSYEELIEDSSINAVYIPLPTTLHKVWIPLIAAKGKHILCEKPVTESISDLNDLLSICNANNVVFMDGVMFMHHERIALLRHSLSDPLFGEVTKVSSNFYFHAPPDFFISNIRASSAADPLGAVGDLGWYCVRLAILAFSQGKDTERDADGKYTNIAQPKVLSRWTASAEYPLERQTQRAGANICHSAAASCFLRGNTWRYAPMLPDLTAGTEYVLTLFLIEGGTIIVCETAKVVTMDDFVLPRHSHDASYTLESFPPAGPIGAVDHRWMSSLEKITGRGEQEINMFTNFAALVNSTDCAVEKFYWQEISSTTQRVMDACMKSLASKGEEIVV